MSLVLDAAVLEPDFDLFLRKTEVRGHLNSSKSGQVDSIAECFFQLEQLMAAECRPRPPSGSAGNVHRCSRLRWT